MAEDAAPLDPGRGFVRTESISRRLAVGIMHGVMVPVMFVMPVLLA